MKISKKKIKKTCGCTNNNQYYISLKTGLSAGYITILIL